MNRYQNKRKRKKNRLKRFFLFLFVLILIIVGYVLFQYYQGLKAAGDSDLQNTTDQIEFEGEKVNELGKVNFLLLGVDSRGEEKSRTDTIMIAQYDPKNDTAKLVSIMRDIYAEIPGYNNYKINTAYFLGGAELLRKTLKQNFDVDIHYFALIDFKGFEQVVDTLAPNGVEIDVEKRMSEKIGLVLEPGLQRLNGKELLGYARFRQDAEGDFGRVARQQKVINAMKDEFVSFNGITKLPKLVGTIQPYVQTNMGSVDILTLLKDFVVNSPEKIETMRIPIDNSYTDEYYEGAGAVLDIDFEQNKEALKAFLDGDTTQTEEANTNGTE